MLKDKNKKFGNHADVLTDNTSNTNATGLKVSYDVVGIENFLSGEINKTFGKYNDVGTSTTGNGTGLEVSYSVIGFDTFTTGSSSKLNGEYENIGTLNAKYNQNKGITVSFSARGLRATGAILKITADSNGNVDANNGTITVTDQGTGYKEDDIIIVEGEKIGNNSTPLQIKLSSSDFDSNGLLNTGINDLRSSIIVGSSNASTTEVGKYKYNYK